MPRFMYKIAPLTPDEANALQRAVVEGALSERLATLRELLRANKDHYSIANSIEREIDALASAGRAVMDARGGEE